MAETSAQPQYPRLNPYADSNTANTTTSAASNGPSHDQGKSFWNNAQQTAQATMSDIKNSQTVHDLANGPVAQKAANEAAATKNEFGNLAASRQTPSAQTATGQDLTHYHSFFYNLLSWEHPRATAISYATIVLSILAFRYVPVAKYAFKALYIVLGITAAAEITGKLLLNQGVATKLRPSKYYTIPQETLDSVIVDGVELCNFFVIEFQRIVFAENVYATVAAFSSSFLSYYLIKVVPTWGLLLFFTTVLYFAPLIYVTNKELIDEQLGNAQKIVSEQTEQVRSLAAENANKAWQATQSATKEYTAKAQEAIGQASAKTQETVAQTKQAAVDKGYVSQETADKVTPTPATAEEVTPQSGVSNADFPTAPKEEPAVTEVVDPTAELKTESHGEPLVAL
ncbi:Reticulon-like protein [Cercospora zeina]